MTGFRVGDQHGGKIGKAIFCAQLYELTSRTMAAAGRVVVLVVSEQLRWACEI